MADEFNQADADSRHRERRERLQKIRNELSDIVNDYYERFPESGGEEGDLEYRIVQRLRSVQRGMDSFIADFRRMTND